MPREFYTIPFMLGTIMRQKEHPRCSLQQSVAQQLHLLLTTAFGDCPIDEGFGCSIWDHDFDNLTSGSKLKEIIRQSLLKSISEHEKRLAHVRIDLVLSQEELKDNHSRRRVKMRMDVSVSGILQSTNEKYTYKDSFFIGPLSY